MIFGSTFTDQNNPARRAAGALAGARQTGLIWPDLRLAPSRVRAPCPGPFGPQWPRVEAPLLLLVFGPGGSALHSDTAHAAHGPTTQRRQRRGPLASGPGPPGWLRLLSGHWQWQRPRRCMAAARSFPALGRVPLAASRSSPLRGRGLSLPAGGVAKPRTRRLPAGLLTGKAGPAGPRSLAAAAAAGTSCHRDCQRALTNGARTQAGAALRVAVPLPLLSRRH